MDDMILPATPARCAARDRQFEKLSDNAVGSIRKLRSIIFLDMASAPAGDAFKILKRKWKNLAELRRFVVSTCDRTANSSLCATHCAFQPKKA
jgi:hypothetical protein